MVTKKEIKNQVMNLIIQRKDWIEEPNMDSRDWELTNEYDKWYLQACQDINNWL